MPSIPRESDTILTIIDRFYIEMSDEISNDKLWFDHCTIHVNHQQGVAFIATPEYTILITVDPSNIPTKLTIQARNNIRQKVNQPLLEFISNTKRDIYKKDALHGSEDEAGLGSFFDNV